MSARQLTVDRGRPSEPTHIDLAAESWRQEVSASAGEHSGYLRVMEQQIDPAVGETIWAAVQSVWEAAQGSDGATEIPEIRAASSDADARGVPDRDIAEHAGVDVTLVRAWLEENNDVRVVVASQGETRLVEDVMHPDSGV